MWTVTMAGATMAKLLLVDDDVDMRDALAQWLGDEHDVRTASNVPEALEVIAAGPLPDIIITDFDMAPHRGDALLAAVAAHYPTVGRILHTGSHSRKVEDARALAHHTLAKGCELDDFRRAIEACLRALSA
jgi:DNA-binding NtrC family response regulator